MHIRSLAAIISLSVLFSLVFGDLIHNPTLIDHVNREQPGWRAGHNPRFANMTYEQASKLLGLIDTPSNEPASARSAARLVSATTLPESFDARTRWPACGMPVRDQGTCGGCWAFAASSVFGMRQCIQTNGAVKVDMGPQVLLNCDTADGGCRGGTLSGAWKYFIASGTVAESAYPFNKALTTCSVSANAKRYKATSYRTLASVAEMQQEIYNYGAIQVAYDVYADFYSYKSGVYRHTTGSKVGGHSVYLVGWGKDGYGTPYWIAINSWGTYFGMNGVFYIRRGTNECNIETGYKPVTGFPQAIATPTTTTTRAPTTTTTTRAPTTTTTRAPSTYTTTGPTALQPCATCPATYSLWYQIGMTSSTNGDRCQCIPNNCWTCAPGWTHWWTKGMAAPSGGDRCQCVPL